MKKIFTSILIILLVLLATSCENKDDGLDSGLLLPLLFSASDNAKPTIKWVNNTALTTKFFVSASGDCTVTTLDGLALVFVNAGNSSVNQKIAAGTYYYCFQDNTNGYNKSVSTYSIQQNQDFTVTLTGVSTFTSTFVQR